MQPGVHSRVNLAEVVSRSCIDATKGSGRLGMATDLPGSTQPHDVPFDTVADDKGRPIRPFAYLSRDGGESPSGTALTLWDTTRL